MKITKKLRTELLYKLNELMPSGVEVEKAIIYIKDIDNGEVKRITLI